MLLHLCYKITISIKHGAGIWIPTFAPFLWPSFVGKYSSTMEHMGTCNGQDKDSPINHDGMTIAHPMSLDHGTYLVIDCFFPIRFQKTWFLTILKKQNYSGTVFFSNTNALLRPIMLPNAFLHPVMLFLVKRRNHTISDLENSFILRNMLRTVLNGFWTLFERSWTRTLFFTQFGLNGSFTLCVFWYFSFFVIFLEKNSLKYFKLLFWNHVFADRK